MNIIIESQHALKTTFSPFVSHRYSSTLNTWMYRNQSQIPHANFPLFLSSYHSLFQSPSISSPRSTTIFRLFDNFEWYFIPLRADPNQPPPSPSHPHLRPRPLLVESAMATDGESGQPLLSAVVDAFEELAKRVKSVGDDDDGEGLALDKFCDACSLVSLLFSCLGLAFKFAESEYVAKVCNLLDASKRHRSLKNVLDLDVQNGTVRTQGSHSRNLRRVRQGLDLIRALFQQFVTTDDNSLKDAATRAYSQVCAPFHTWAVRTAVYAGMYTLPSREQLLIRLNETDQSAEKKMRRYIDAALPVINYIDNLYISRNISLDW